jgi:antitoxin component YwqK of YwqJK toxin-antitoxin module
MVRYGGEWQNDIRSGIATNYDKIGNIKFEGEYEDGKAAKGILYNSNG